MTMCRALSEREHFMTPCRACRSEYDYRLTGPRKAEIVDAIARAYAGALRARVCVCVQVAVVVAVDCAGDGHACV